MKPKILEHKVTLRVIDETREPCLCLEIAYSDSIGKHQWWFIKDLPEDFQEEHVPTYIETFLKAVEETEKKKKEKDKQMKQDFKEYKELERLLKNTKHDEESMKLAVKEFHDKKNGNTIN